MRLKKHLLGLVFIGFFLFADTVTASASSEVQVRIDREIINLNPGPFIQDGFTFVPMRGIFEALGAELIWVSETRQVIATRDENTIVLTIDSYAADRNGNTIHLMAAPQNVGGHTFVPLRFIAESLDADVGWDGITRTVNIATSPRELALGHRPALRGFTPGSNVDGIRQEPDGRIVIEVYIPFNTSDPATLARHVALGNVVFFDGQFWSTPAFATMNANVNVVYFRNISGFDVTEAFDRFALRDIDLDGTEMWTTHIGFRRMSIRMQELEQRNIPTNNMPEAVQRGFVSAYGFFVGGGVNLNTDFIVYEMTEDFINSENAYGVFNGIQMRMRDGELWFNRNDLRDRGIL